MSQFRNNIANLKDGIWIATLIGVPLSFILTTMVLGLWTLYGDVVISKARHELGVDRNYKLIIEALGEDRVLRQPRGLSYVEEPVFVGGQMAVNVVIERTDMGSHCILKEGHILFIEPGGNIINGGRFDPLRQISTDMTRLRMVFDAPTPTTSSHSATPRWAVYFVLEYTCELVNIHSSRGQAQRKTIYEDTYPMPFFLRNSSPK